MLRDFVARSTHVAPQWCCARQDQQAVCYIVISVSAPNLLPSCACRYSACRLQLIAVVMCMNAERVCRGGETEEG